MDQWDRKWQLYCVVSDFEMRQDTSARARRGEHVTRGKRSNFRRLKFSKPEIFICFLYSPLASMLADQSLKTAFHSIRCDSSPILANSRVFHEEKNDLFVTSSLMGLTKMVYLPPHESKFTGVSPNGLDGKILDRFSPWGIVLTLIINKWESI